MEKRANSRRRGHSPPPVSTYDLNSVPAQWVTTERVSDSQRKEDSWAKDKAVEDYVCRPTRRNVRDTDSRRVRSLLSEGTANTTSGVLGETCETWTQTSCDSKCDK